MNVSQRISGALYGFAIGDAMGATTEFMSPEKLKAVYGEVNDIIGGGWLHLKAGEVTDDTQMMFCVADALVNSDLMLGGCDFLDGCCTNFVKWFESKPKDIGNACREAIALCKYKPCSAWFDVAKSDEKLGNGSLMRCLFPAILYAITNDSVYRWAAQAQGWLTHNNAVCDRYIREYCNALDSLAIDEVPSCFIKADISDNSGRVDATFNSAVYHALSVDSFDEAIINAVNCGGDADTIAALTGGLAGFKFGLSAIPKRWIEKLDEDVAEKLDKLVVAAMSLLINDSSTVLKGV